jgi:hypothetical protein
MPANERPRCSDGGFDAALWRHAARSACGGRWIKKAATDSLASGRGTNYRGKCPATTAAAAVAAGAAFTVAAAVTDAAAADAVAADAAAASAAAAAAAAATASAAAESWWRPQQTRSWRRWKVDTQPKRARSRAAGSTKK